MSVLTFLLQRLKREKTPERTPQREAAAKTAQKSPSAKPEDIKSGSEEGEIEDDE
jgi:hypothetical protein